MIWPIVIFLFHLFIVSCFEKLLTGMNFDKLCCYHFKLKYKVSAIEIKRLFIFYRLWFKQSFFQLPLIARYRLSRKNHFATRLSI